MPTPGDAGQMARWLAILGAFTQRDVWGVRELGQALGLPKSSVHRQLHEMQRLGLLATTDEDGRFEVGPELARLAVLLAERLDVRHIARPVLEATMQQVDETVILALYSPARRQFWAVEAAEASHPIRYIWESLRAWSDLHLGSSGKGILAFLPETEREAILAALPDPIPTPRPITKVDLRAQLDRARQHGYVLSRGERFAGAIGVSAPIRDAQRRVIGDIIISWPDNRTDPGKEADAADAVKTAAALISQRLGHREVPSPDAHGTG